MVEKFVGGTPVRYIAALLGSLGVILIIVALAVDKLWYDTDVNLGWNEFRPDSGSEEDYSDSGDTEGAFDRGRAWLCCGILGAVAGIVGIFCATFNAIFIKVGDISWAILFVLSALSTGIGSLVVSVYDGPSGIDLDPGHSVWVMLTASGIMTLPVWLSAIAVSR